MRADMRTDLLTLQADLEGYEVRICYLDGSKLKEVYGGRSFSQGEVLSSIVFPLSSTPQVLVRNCNCPTYTPTEADERKPMLIPLGDVVGVEVSDWVETGEYDRRGHLKDELTLTVRWLRDSSGGLRRFTSD